MLRFAFQLLVVLLPFMSPCQWSPPFIIDPAGYVPLLVATSDFDNDGDLDVVSISPQVPNLGYEMMRVHVYDHSTDEFIAKPYSYVFPPFNYFPWYVYVADFNGDGWLDILSTWRSSVMDQHCFTIIHYNNGAGVFLEPVIVPIQQTYFSLVAMDTDTDGDTDLIVRTLLGMLIMFNDGFGDYMEGGSIYLGLDGEDDRARQCDLDGDAYPDLVFENINSVRLLQNSDQGFMEPVVIPSYGTHYLADMDGDGLDDLVDRDVNAIRIRTNLGGTVFSAPVLVDDVFDPSLTYEWHPLDLDGEGDMDLVIRSQTPDNDFALILLRNNGGLSFTSDTLIPGGGELSSVAPVHAWEHGGVDHVLVTSMYRLFRYEVLPGPSLQLKGSLTNNISSIGYGRSAHVADMDMDGTLDLVLANYRERSVWYYPDVANNDRVQRFLYHLDDDMLDLGVADVDQDGAPDLLIETSSGTFIHWALGPGQFSGPAESAGTVTTDLDGDGDLDLLERKTINTPPKLYLNLGNGAFQPITMPQAGMFSYTFSEAIDWNGDGLLDPIYRVNNTNWIWSSENDYGTTSYNMNLSGFYILAIDVEPDGDRDMIVSSNNMLLYRNQTGQLPLWSSGEPIMQPLACTACRPLAIDANKDGYTDLIAYGMNGSYLLLNDTQGGFQEAESFPAGQLFQTEAMVADLDADDDDDIVFLNGSTLQWIENFAFHPNTVSGAVFADIDGDGQLDDAESGIPSAVLSVQPASFIQFSGSTGEFTVYSELGQQQVSVGLNNPYWTLSTGSSSISVELTVDEPHVEDVLFGFTPIADTSVVEVTTEVASSTCNGLTTMWVHLSNQGTRDELASLSVTLDENWTFISAVPAPVSNNNGVLVWAPDTLGLFQSRSYSLELQVPDVDQIGTELIDQITVSSSDLDGGNESIFSNTGSYVNNCAYDPNDKRVEPAGFGMFQAIPLGTEALTYTIRFQNTGNAVATNVTLRDQLHPALVPASISLIGASHEVDQVYVEQDNELVVKFNAILLPPSVSDMAGSQGYFKFRIQLVDGLSHLTEVENSAAIYFDLNPPIITNTTNVLLVDCELWEPSITVTSDSLIATEGVMYQWYQNGIPLTDATQRSLSIGQNGSYTVSVTSMYGCVNLSPEHVVLTVGSSSLDHGQISVFPNPFNDQVTIAHDLPLDGHHTIELVDMIGRTLRSFNGEGTRRFVISTVGLADGIYILRHVYAGRAVGSWRIIKDSAFR